MADVTVSGVVDRQFAWILGILVANLAEERGKTVVVVQRPAVERVVMALGTLNPRSQEHLRDAFTDQVGRGFRLEEVDCGIVEGSAHCREQFLHHLIDGRTAANLVPQPLVVELQSFRSDTVHGADL